MEDTCMDNVEEVDFYEENGIKKQIKQDSAYELQDRQNIDCTKLFETDRVFISKEELISWTKSIRTSNEIVVVMKKSDTGSNGRRPRIDFACERSGVYRFKAKPKDPKDKKGDEKEKRIGTRKCNCPFSLKGRMIENSSHWKLTVSCGTHNHRLTRYLEGHPHAGKLNNEEMNLLVDMTKCNVRPKHILYRLKQNNEQNCSTMKHIYNARQRLRLKEQDGRSISQQLMHLLVVHNYMEWHRSNDVHEVITDLFFAHPVSIDLLRAFSHVIILDCTYKTNKYKLPLLEIVGVTSTNMTFSIACAYLEFEKEDNYRWVLERLKSLMYTSCMSSVILTDREKALMNAVAEVFPTSAHHLCRWHISKNVLGNTKKLFKDKETWENFNHFWHNVVSSKTIMEYDLNMEYLERNFSECKEAIHYVKHVWLNPYKTMFVSAWTDLHMHLGNSTTNRAESAHAALKRKLKTSQGNLVSNWDNIHQLLELQHTQIKASFEMSLISLQQHLKPEWLYKELKGCVSRTALEIIFNESGRADHVSFDATTCGCAKLRTHGLPCAHVIDEYKRLSRPLALSLLHSHWMKLSLAPISQDDDLDLDCYHLYEKFMRRFHISDKNVKIQMYKAFSILADPSTTNLDEPLVKQSHRGRPTKAECSTRRDPSCFEYAIADNTFDADHGSQIIVSSDGAQFTSKKRKLPIKRAQVIVSSPYLSQLPIQIKPYVVRFNDVLGDGNCDFRAVAIGLGFEEECWPQVRADMLNELQNHYDDYTCLYDNLELLKELWDKISHFNGSCGPEKYMTLPDMGHIIASTYNVVLRSFSLHDSWTFLPLWTEPPTDQKIISICFVDGNHFVEVLLQHDAPMPPIHPAWHAFRNPCAQRWIIPYARQIEDYNSVVSSSSSIVTNNQNVVFDLDCDD